jgi:hypothetical protein
VIACKREKLLFPIGSILQTITSPEIEYLLEHPEIGTIEKIVSLVAYEKAPVFTEYVDFFYNIRTTTKNEAYENMAKLMLNSLYGKLGQHCSTIPEIVKDKNEIATYCGIMDSMGTNEIFADDSPGSKYVRLGETLYKIIKKDSEFSRDSIPIIASAVTSYSRMLLWKLMKIAEIENLLYCDTDSLFVTETGYENLKDEISPTIPGKLKLVKTGSVNIKGCKNYTFNSEIKLKGIKKNAIQLSPTEYKQHHFQTKSTRYRRGTPDGEVILEPIIKTISNKYDKGIVRDGRVGPLTFTETWEPIYTHSPIP